jgi:hypothetical protein
MQKELMQRFKERELLDHEVDTTSMDEMFNIYNDLGGLGQDSMQRELEEDFAQLEEILGELNYEEMSVLRATNPNLFIIIIQKVYNFLMYLSHVGIKDEDGNDSHINLYEEAIDTLFERNVVDGQVPEWLVQVKMIFDWGSKFSKVVEKAQNGEFADSLADLIPQDMTMSMLNVDNLDTMLI